jgi:leukotriene B4 12-hydroxydehydrogenase/15-oxo-prostaglandin 13-reductase
MVNRQFVLASRPVGMPKESDLRLIETPVPALRDGEVLLRALYLSVDPYMRGRMNAAKSYAPSVEIGELMVGGGVARVVESKNPDYDAGDVVNLQMGWQEYAVSNGEGLRKVDPHVAPVSTALGVLGMPGLTAYFGLLEVCGVNAGETVVVSAAAGAVGSVVGQIAKIKGCRAVGIAGGAEKTQYILDECGFDAALDYKNTSDYAAAIKELCPSGVDVYFDNVGGPITDAVLANLNARARIAICGQISHANDTQPSTGPRMWRHILVARAKVQGFLVFDYAARYASALEQLAQWVRSGQIKYHEDIIEGFENMPRALIGLFRGENLGKRLVKI